VACWSIRLIILKTGKLLAVFAFSIELTTYKPVRIKQSHC